MKKSSVNNLDVTIFYEKLANGLEVFLVPKNNVNNIFATYSTKYGSNQNDFVPINQNKMITVPLGIAHFLEHQLFNQEDESDVMKFFSERGTDVNANTNKLKTTYLFGGPDFFEENLEFLLSYVESPYFTEASVEKEKGIIEQEIKMYRDRPFSRLHEGIVYNAFHNHPIKYPIIGNVESIRKITKEDLYTCYNTFYHPANMFLVVTGNIDPDKTLELVKQHEEKRNLNKFKNIKLKTYEEPDSVSKKEEEIELNITIPKVAIAFKINKTNIKKVAKTEIATYLQMIFSLNFGSTSEFAERLKAEEIITSGIDCYPVETDKHVLMVVYTESKQPNEFIKLVKRQVTNLNIAKEDLERRKKSMIASGIYASDSISSINHKIMNEVVKYGKVFTDYVDIIKSYNMDDIKEVLKAIDVNNNTVYIVNPLNRIEK